MKKHQEGTAMIVVMCVMAVAVGLSLALLLSASVAVMNAARSNRKEQCRILAVSVSDVFCKEVETYEYWTSALPEQEEEMAPLQKILTSVATADWPEYDESAETGTGQKQRNVLCYELDSDILPGETVAELYWTDGSEEEDVDIDSGYQEEEAELFSGIKLYLKVTSRVGEESSSIISCFRQRGIKTDIMEDTWSYWKWIYVGRDWEGGDSRWR